MVILELCLSFDFGCFFVFVISNFNFAKKITLKNIQFFIRYLYRKFFKCLDKPFRNTYHAPQFYLNLPNSQAFLAVQIEP